MNQQGELVRSLAVFSLFSAKNKGFQQDNIADEVFARCAEIVQKIEVALHNKYPLYIANSDYKL